MTKTQYVEYQRSVKRFLDVNKVRPGCHGPDDPEHVEASFSKARCELCDGLPGNRTRYSFSMDVPRFPTFSVDICDMCVYYLTYGCLDDETMESIRKDEQSYAEARFALEHILEQHGELTQELDKLREIEIRLVRIEATLKPAADLFHSIDDLTVSPSAQMLLNAVKLRHRISTHLSEGFSGNYVYGLWYASVKLQDGDDFPGHLTELEAVRAYCKHRHILCEL